MKKQVFGIYIILFGLWIKYFKKNDVKAQMKFLAAATKWSSMVLIISFISGCALVTGNPLAPGGGVQKEEEEVPAARLARPTHGTPPRPNSTKITFENSGSFLRGNPRKRLNGDDITVVAAGASVLTSIQASNMLKKKNIILDLFDLRSLTEIKMNKIFDSVKKKQRI